MESLETILLSMNKTLEEFHNIVLALEKTLRDGRQLVKGGSTQATPKQLQQRIGIKPCLADCLDGLSHVYEMHKSEYLLKSSIVSALSVLTLKPSGSDLAALLQLLVDQPNIPREEDAHSLMRKNHYVPLVEDRNRNMQMLSISSIDDLIANSMNILEPAPVDAEGNERKMDSHLTNQEGAWAMVEVNCDTFLMNYQELAKE